MRHEAISLWLCWPHQSLFEWLRPAITREEDYVISLVAAAGHHRKFWSESFSPDDAGAGITCTLLTAHEDFASVLRLAQEKFELPESPKLPNIEITFDRRGHPRRLFARWEQQYQELLDARPELARLSSLAKALVLAADVAGSALPRAGERSDWISSQLQESATGERLELLVTQRLGSRPLRQFQERMAASNSQLTLVRAGCGSGKTAGAYLWAARQHGGRKLWVTYPTTGTATEGYREYVNDTDVVGRLEHSRARVDVELFGLSDGDIESRELDRLDAIRAWGSEVVTCTVDTVLGLIQNQRRGVYAWPALAHAAFVFDEVHAYDDELFGALLRFLEALPGVPALLMTASLPRNRQDALNHLCSALHHRDLSVIEGPEDLERLPRYQQVREFSLDQTWVRASETYSQGGKVLWVSNTVDRSVAVAKEAEARGIPAIPYHSRYRYIDRIRRHAEIIDAFREEGPAFASTTQVAEMSLDLSADLLVTDLAPIPAMIQRLGRLNRRSTPEAPREPGPFFVLSFEGLPYESASLNEARQWLASVGVSSISQWDLVAQWQQSAGEIPRTRSAWLDGGFETISAPLRAATPGITVVRTADVEQLEQAPARVTEFAIPMGPLATSEWQSWPRVGWVHVAPDEWLSYDEKWGGQWRHQ
jgi:CRISPR-associated endonuclease/helicase Cas3